MQSKNVQIMNGTGGWAKSSEGRSKYSFKYNKKFPWQMCKEKANYLILQYKARRVGRLLYKQG